MKTGGDSTTEYAIWDNSSIIRRNDWGILWTGIFLEADPSNDSRADVASLFSAGFEGGSYTSRLAIASHFDKIVKVSFPDGALFKESSSLQAAFTSCKACASSASECCCPGAAS